MKLRLQGRYVLVTISLLVAMIAVNSGVHFFVSDQQAEQLLSKLTTNTTQRLQSQLEKRAEGVADYLANALFDPLYFSNPEEAYYVIQAALSLNEVAGVYVVDTQGRIFHDGTESLLNFGRRYQGEEGLVQVLQKAEPYRYATADRFVLGKPIKTGNELVGGLFMEFLLSDIRSDIQQMSGEIQSLHDDKYNKTLLSIAITAVLLLFIGSFCAVFIARSMTSPLRQLMTQTERIGRGDFNGISSIDRNDEIGDLANAFNKMGQELKLHTAEISHQAYHDSLTGLPNRAQFIQHIEQLIESKTQGSFAVLFIDLDEFKSINDNYGHKAGDTFLCDLSGRMKEVLRTYDYVQPTTEVAIKKELVARIGGDEFLICLPILSKANEADTVVARLFEALSSPVFVDNDEVVISGSIGIACYPESGVSADELIKNADIAMYHAKANGKNTSSHFEQQMNERVETRANIERGLRKALNAPEQFELWFQPQFHFGSYKLVGAEALVRWRHPERGLISPNVFLPVAEESGLIIPIGEQLIENLCQQLKQWMPFVGGDFYVALNLSAKQIYRHDLVNSFAYYLNKYQVSAKHVHVEVTESFLMRDENAAEKMLDSLRQLGLQVWLDDFGTGFSSLSYLRRFQVDGLKIDRSFIADIETDQQDRALTSAIISMAHSLNMPVVAEGIENKAQASFLLEQRCDLAQGFLFSEPLPAAEFELDYIHEKKLA